MRDPNKEFREKYIQPHVFMTRSRLRLEASWLRPGTVKLRKCCKKYDSRAPVPVPSRYRPGTVPVRKYCKNYDSRASPCNTGNLTGTVLVPSWYRPGTKAL